MFLSQWEYTGGTGHDIAVNMEVACTVPEDDQAFRDSADAHNVIFHGC